MALLLLGFVDKVMIVVIVFDIYNVIFDEEVISARSLISPSTWILDLFAQFSNLSLSRALSNLSRAE